MVNQTLMILCKVTTPVTNADKHSVIERRSATTSKEPAASMTKAEVKVVLKREKQKACTSTLGL